MSASGIWKINTWYLLTHLKICYSYYFKVKTTKKRRKVKKNIIFIVDESE